MQLQGFGSLMITTSSRSFGAPCPTCPGPPRHLGPYDPEYLTRQRKPKSSSVLRHRIQLSLCSHGTDNAAASLYEILRSRAMTGEAMPTEVIAIHLTVLR